MDKIDFQLPVGARVRLKNQIDTTLYGGLTVAGNQGWIENRRVAKYGYPEVYIKWDHDHWAYNGAEDLWTFESHFDLVEEDDSMGNQEEIAKLASQLASSVITGLKDTIAKRGTEKPASQKEPKSRPFDIEEDPAYATHLQEILKKLGDSDAIFVLSLVDENGFFIPQIFQAAKDPMLAQLLNIQLGFVAANNYEALVKENLEKGPYGKEG